MVELNEKEAMALVHFIGMRWQDFLKKTADYLTEEDASDLYEKLEMHNA